MADEIVCEAGEDVADYDNANPTNGNEFFDLRRESLTQDDDNVPSSSSSSDNQATTPTSSESYQTSASNTIYQ
jgi:hypothetical protein